MQLILTRPPNSWRPHCVIVYTGFVYRAVGKVKRSADGVFSPHGVQNAVARLRPVLEEREATKNSLRRSICEH
jgi:hypothetical protein